MDPRRIEEALLGEDIPSFLRRMACDDRVGLSLILGAANEFKEGDYSIGVGAVSAQARHLARELLGNTRVAYLLSHVALRDGVSTVIERTTQKVLDDNVAGGTLKELKSEILQGKGSSLASALTSDVIACVVKLCNNEELTTISRSIWNPLPGSCIGKRGYLSARIQPNSPTDNLEDILISTLAVLAVGVGDLIVGVNPVSSQLGSVMAIELMLKKLLSQLGIASILPHCVLSHIDVQKAVEDSVADSTAIWFQSIAGSQAGNTTYGVRWEKLQSAMNRKAMDHFAMYFETGQGSEFTNHAHGGVDMVLLESRKYGLVRALTSRLNPKPWVHVNDVAGFIGPEVYRTREQLVRCCLEDIVMGKLHGLTTGCDVCATLHMDVSYDELGSALDEIVAAGPAYLMALPTRMDCMLGYLSTSARDHFRIRKKFGLQIDPQMERFFQERKILSNDEGAAGENWGRIDRLYAYYCRCGGDMRNETELMREAQEMMERVRARGVFIHDDEDFDAENKIRELDARSRQAIYREWPLEWIQDQCAGGQSILVKSRSVNRKDYVDHPPSGERLSLEGAVRGLASPAHNLAIIISDGLNVTAITLHLHEFLPALGAQLSASRQVVPMSQYIIVQNGRVRVGYQCGALLFGENDGAGVIIHLIGERPGSGTDTFSAYVTAATGPQWKRGVDHDVTAVVSGISHRALALDSAARQVADMVFRLFEAVQPKID